MQPTSGETVDEPDDQQEDPATAAVRHNLDALRSALDATPDGRSQSMRAHLADLSPPTIAKRSEHGDRLLAIAIEALSERVERVAAWQRDDHAQAASVQRALDAAEATIDAQQAEIAHLRRRIDDLGHEHSSSRESLVGDIGDLHADLARMRARNEALVHALRDDPDRTRSADPATADAVEAALDATLSASRDDLYRDLERHFRGSREHVKGLVTTYLDDVRGVTGPIVDIGCGRGEWLELLGEHDLSAYGVDLNATFAAENRDRGLDVRHGDAIAHLQGVEPDSVGAVTGMHLAEHLPTDVLISLLDAALAALEPGGVLILETPNPTNVRVGAGQFWIDPTHERPLHPEFLEFLCTQRGFTEVVVRPLHPGRHGTIDWGDALGIDVADGSAGAEILEDVREALAGGQDYAVLARAPG